MRTAIRPIIAGVLLLWDLDVSLGSQFSLGTTDGLFWCANEPSIQRFYTNAAFLRSYWRAINDAVSGPMLSSNISPIMAGNYIALSANSVSVGNPNSGGLSNWVYGRRGYLTNQLDGKTTIVFSTTNSTSSSES